MVRGKTWLLVLVATIISALLVAACAPAAAPPASNAGAKTETKADTKAEAKPAADTKAESKPAAEKPKQLIKLKVAHPHKGLAEISNAPIAALKGFFKEEGLDVEFYYTKGGADTIRALTTGGVDLALDTGPMGILGAIEQGTKLKIISAGVTGPNFYWMVPKDSPVKTIKDLAGKKIGYSEQGSSTNLALMAILEQEKVKAEAVTSGNIADSWTAAKTKQIDAAWAAPPDTYKLEQEGARSVFTSRDYPALRDYTYIVNVATPEMISKKRDAFIAFNRALNKAADFVANDPEGAAKVFKSETNLPEDMLVRYYKSIKPKEMWNLGEIKGWDTIIKYAKLFKFATKDFTLQDVADLSTVPKQ